MCVCVCVFVYVGFQPPKHIFAILSVFVLELLLDGGMAFILLHFDFEVSCFNSFNILLDTLTKYIVK